MRAFGVTLVTLALVLGAGGVARRPLADTTPEAAAAVPAQTPAAPPAEGSSDGAMCKPGTPPKVIEMDMSKLEPPKGFVSLNGRGYNYRQPGEAPQIIPDSTGTQPKPDGVK